ncbi:MAG: ester cyclase [Chloroflexi bacterium]|nr:ester cyclase [Chloroflexota bacterium]
MSEQNKRLVRRYYDMVLDGKHMATLDEIFASNFVGRMSNGADSHLEAFRAALLTTHTAFPDLKVTIHEQIAEGDKVVTRWWAEGTHRGPYIGIMEATGKSVVFTGIHIHRVREGRIVELWEEVNLLGLMQQLAS